MSHRALGPQFFHPDDLGHLKSNDYGGRLRDIDFAPGGDSDQRVQEIMSTAKSEGIREPIQVESGGWPYLRDGHHRYVAARRLGIQLPVRGM